MAFDPRRGAWLRRSRHQRAVAINPGLKFDEGTGYTLSFEATVSQPDYAKLFLVSGGAINTAAAAGPNDFAVTSSTAAVMAQLYSNECRNVSIDLPAGLIKVGHGTLTIDACSKLNASSQRVGAAINGTLVDTHAGAGSIYLANLLQPESCHTQLACVYGTLASHACTLGISKARITDASGEEVDIEFVMDADKHSLLEKAEKLVDEWARSAWDLREKVQYRLSPRLTKSVAKVPVGINDKGYDLVHNIIDQEFPFSIQALDSLMQHTVAVELAQNQEDIDKMLEGAASPGYQAAVWAQTIAAACSTAAAYLVAYRADGRTVMQAAGSGFESTESWLRTPMRTPCEANDCDGSGLLVLSLIQAAVDASDDDLEQYAYVRAVKNVLCPYYTWGIAVVAATSAEASAGGGDTVAGHALALLVPTLSLLEGLDRAASQHTVAGKRVAASPGALRAARFNSVFNDDVMASLPDSEQEKLREGDWKALKLQPYAIEGTTPASPILYMEDAEQRAAHEQDSKRDTEAFSKAAPNVGRSIKVLHVGGKNGGHRFYRDVPIEYSVHPSHPLYSGREVRQLSGAATQFLFARPDTTAIDTAGCSPKQLVQNDYVVLPLHTVDDVRGQILDYAASVSKNDVIPPRAGATVLSASQSRDLRRSVAALEALDAKMSATDVNGHCIAYMFAYSSLANNPQAIEHFCDRAGAVAVAGVVDFRIVEGLAVHPGEGGEEAGVFVVANVVVKI